MLQPDYLISPHDQPGPRIHRGDTTPQVIYDKSPDMNTGSRSLAASTNPNTKRPNVKDISAMLIDNAVRESDEFRV